MQNPYYVYAHRKASNNEIFYIGKGKCRRYKSKSSRNDRWHKTVNKHGLICEILISNLTEEESFLKEIEMIKKLKSEGVDLCNMSDGGEGNSGHIHSEVTREKISKAHKGKKQPIDLVMKRAAVLKGKKRTKEICEAIAARNRARVVSAATKEKMSIARTGMKRSEESIIKVAEWHRGKKRSAESRARMSDSQPKRPVSCSNGMIFKSMSLAAEWLVEIGFSKATKTGIWLCLSPKHRNVTYHGFSWQYV